VEFVNYTPVPGYNTDMRWIGTHRGPSAVRESLAVFLGMCEVRSEELVRLVVDGEEAMGVVHEVSVVRDTGREFDIEFVQHLTVRDGRIVRWKSYTDPSPIVRAIRA
jgi:ketosteroid isomerase-like protein